MGPVVFPIVGRHAFWAKGNLDFLSTSLGHVISLRQNYTFIAENQQGYRTGLIVNGDCEIMNRLVLRLLFLINK